MREHEVDRKNDEDDTLISENIVRTAEPTERQTTEFDAPTIKDVTVEVTKDAYHCKTTKQAKMNVLDLHIDLKRLLVQTSKIDGLLKKMPASLRECILYIDHYPPAAGYPDERCMYETMRQNVV